LSLDTARIRTHPAQATDRTFVHREPPLFLAAPAKLRELISAQPVRMRRPHASILQQHAAIRSKAHRKHFRKQRDAQAAASIHHASVPNAADRDT